MNLSEIADISLGTILTRIKPKSELDEVIELDTISMQELSYVSGNSDKEVEITTSKILKDKTDKCVITRENDIVIGLSSQNAMVINKDRSERLLLSNFCLVRFNQNDVIDPYYFMWLFNESKTLKQQLTGTMQGSANVKMFSLETVRNLDITPIEFEQQIKIGKLYKLCLERNRISKKTIELKNILLNEQLDTLIK